MTTIAPADRYLVEITDLLSEQTDEYCLSSEELTRVFGPELAAKFAAVHAERGRARLRTRRLWLYRRSGLARHCIAYDI